MDVILGESNVRDELRRMGRMDGWKLLREVADVQEGRLGRRTAARL